MLAKFLAPIKGGLWAFMLAHLSHHICTGILVPLLPLIRDHFSLNYFMSGLMVSSFNLTYGISQIPIGRLADRKNKRLMIVVGLAGLATATLVTGLAQNYYLMLACLVLMAVFGGAYHPCASSLLVERFPQAQRGLALGLHLIGGSSSFIVAPLSAGIIAQSFGWRGAYILLGIPTLIASVIFWRSTRPTGIASAESSALKKTPSVNFWELMRVVGVIVAIAVLSQIIFAGVIAFLPLYLVDKHGVPAAYAGMLVGLINGAGILGAPFGGALSDRIGRKSVIMISVGVAGPFLYLLTVLPFGPAFVGTLIAMGFLLTSRTPVMESLIADTVPPERLAGILGIYYFLNTEVSGISTPIVGLLADTFGLNTVFTLLAALAIAASGLIFLVRGKA